MKKPHYLEETISKSSNLHYKGGPKIHSKNGVITKPYYSRVISPQANPFVRPFIVIISTLITGRGPGPTL